MIEINIEYVEYKTLPKIEFHGRGLAELYPVSIPSSLPTHSHRPCLLPFYNFTEHSLKASWQYYL